jgi:hypothetical protein
VRRIALARRLQLGLGVGTGPLEVGRALVALGLGGVGGVGRDPGGRFLGVGGTPLVLGSGRLQQGVGLALPC